MCLQSLMNFDEFDEFSSLPFQDIKEKPKYDGRTDGKTDGRENSIPLPSDPQTQFAGGGG